MNNIKIILAVAVQTEIIPHSAEMPCGMILKVLHLTGKRYLLNKRKLHELWLVPPTLEARVIRLCSSVFHFFLTNIYFHK
jgi:hypothetical protein